MHLHNQDDLIKFVTIYGSSRDLIFRFQTNLMNGIIQLMLSTKFLLVVMNKFAFVSIPFLAACLLVGCNKNGENTENISQSVNEASQSTNLRGQVNNHEWVDLGLPSGTKWATCNVGATSPYECGTYFAWGETSPKSEYLESNCKTYDISLSKLMADEIVNSSGELMPAYDAATASWGSPWRMPVEEEFDELEEKCQWSWTTENNINGYLVTGPNGSTIFLPAAGCRTDLDKPMFVGEYAQYWGATASDNSKFANRFGFSSNGLSNDYNLRDVGQTVRPVIK